jgi:hypothetical protein
MRRSALFVALAVVSGCATYDRVARPPSPSDIAGVNEIAARGGTFSLRYVEPLPLRAANAPAAPYDLPSPTGLVSADDERLVVSTAKGPPVAVPLARVKAIAVSGQRRDRGAILGGFIGAGTGMVLDFGLYELARSMNGSLSDGGGNDTCGDNRCVLPFTVVALSTAAIGAAFGALIGSNTVFELAPPRPPTP